MNTELKITKGEWFVEKDPSDKSIVYVKCINGDDEDWMTLTIYNYSNIDKKEREFAKANAELIADAGNTIQQCNLLPSELLKQNKEMRELLENIYQDYSNTGEDMREVKVRIGKYLESTNP